MSENLTPMMQQYQRIKREIPSDALLLFRLGDFYEMFFDDAKTGASLLNLTLTKRNGVPMCGMPHHSAEGYIGKLIQAGKRVAVCDQVSEPRPGQVVERQVTQIFSPGCVLNLELTRPKENRFLAAVHKHHGRYGFAFLDLTTGDFRVTEMPDLRGFQDEIIRLQPKELLHPAEQMGIELPDGAGVSQTAYDDWVFESDFAQLTLKEHFKVQSLDGYGCAGLTAGIGAAGALIHYVTQTLRTTAAHVLGLKSYSTGDYLVLDAVTQKNLELVESASGAASDTSLLRAVDHTVTAMGGRELRNWILHPLRTVDPIRARQQVVDAWLADVGRLEEFREALQEVRDLERLIGRLAQGSGNARDLQALRHSLEQLPRLRTMASGLQAPLAAELAAGLVDQPELVDLIARALVADPPLALKEGGLIATGYHPELDELHTAMREGKNWLADLQVREQERTGIKSLKVRFNQVFGYYIEITKANLEQVPADYTRKQTMVNAERFITPELKEMENKILGAEERSRKLEYEIFLEIRSKAVEKTREIQESARALAALDALAGLAQLARMRDYKKPEIHPDGPLHITEGRHPVLELKLKDEKFVPNDSLLDNDNNRLIILTGPNMAGKSTYIRQVALLSLLAHIGSYVPAQSARIPILDRIFTRIGASDDLSRGQSTFMVEMNETANILNHATSKSLVILDEIGRGTSTFDGLSIAWAVAEHLHTEVRARTLFATHYHELTELAASLAGVKNYNVAVREWHDQIIFLRKIVPGGADKSYGIQVARLAGLPKAVLDRAKEILRKLEENELDATGQPALMAPKTKAAKKKARLEPPQMDLFKSLLPSEKLPAP
jgi:DNA mismatch repair protein MutS